MARGSKGRSESSSGGPGERQSLYFPKEMLDEIKAESLSQDRSLSWIIQQAWSIARLRVSSKGRQTLLDTWIMQKGWTVENPGLNQIVESSSGPGAKRRG